MSQPPLISVQNLGFTYPGTTVPALTDLTFQVARGEWVALVGSNGSGKSTLARILNALLVPTQGACFVDGMNCSDESLVWEIRRKLSMVFQNPENQIVSTVVEDEVAFGPENLGLPSEEIRRRVDNALEVTGLTEKASKAVYTLSGGQKQRLAIAGALAMKSDCLLLDEPTAMLDPQGRAEVLELLGRLHSLGHSIVLISHHLEEVMAADRVLVLLQGRLVWEGAPEEMLLRPELETLWGLQLPPLYRLRNDLVKSGVLTAGTMADLEALTEALCQYK